MEPAMHKSCGYSNHLLYHRNCVSIFMNIKCSSLRFICTVDMENLLKLRQKTFLIRILRCNWLRPVSPDRDCKRCRLFHHCTARIWDSHLEDWWLRQELCCYIAH